MASNNQLIRQVARGILGAERETISLGRLERQTWCYLEGTSSQVVTLSANPASNTHEPTFTLVSTEPCGAFNLALVNNTYQNFNIYIPAIVHLSCFITFELPSADCAITATLYNQLAHGDILFAAGYRAAGQSRLSLSATRYVSIGTPNAMNQFRFRLITNWASGNFVINFVRAHVAWLPVAVEV